MAAGWTRVPMPRLMLNSNNNNSNTTASPASGARSAPTLLDADTKPRCPRCEHTRAAHQWAFWPEHGEWVWHCNFGTDGRATAKPDKHFCGNMWRVSRPRASCDTCGSTLAIERRGKAIVYVCDACFDVSH